MEKIAGKHVADIKLFALSTCPWCRKTKALLDTMGVEYEFADVDLASGMERQKMMEIIQKWNPRGSFPTLVINDKKCIVGFMEQEIREALKG